MNARENFWNVYCFATNQMRDETAKDNRQTAAGISHDLIRNNELAFFLQKSLIFPLDLSEKAILWPQTKTSHLIPSIQKPNCLNRPESECKLWKFKAVQVGVMGESFSATKKYGSKTTNPSMTFWTVRGTNTEKHRLWLAHFSCSQTRCLAVSDPVFLINSAFP